MFTGLSAQNFKSWQDTGSLQFAPLTGLFGANSSGKSSLLQLLLLLKQTVERPPEWDEPLYFGDDESLVDLRSFDDAIRRPVEGPSLGDAAHRPVGERSLGISVSWRLPKKMPLMGMYEFDALSLYFNLFNQSIGRMSYQGGECQFGIAHKSGSYEIILPNVGQLAFYRRGLVRPFRCYGFRFNPSSNTQQFSNLEKSFEDLFTRMHYLGPLREDPRRYYTWEKSHPKDVGWYGEQMISALLSSRIRRHHSIDEQIMRWLQELDLIYSYDFTPLSDIEQNYELLVQQYKDGPEVGLTDIGFGVSQVLPVLTACYYVPEGSILILEQPEAHLHPKAQSELADVLIDVVKTRNIQIILESHSEHLLHRLQRRIAEEQFSADDTAFYFCQINDGISEIEKLDVDQYGNILNYPADFFGDDLGDLVKKTEAEMKRREVME